MDEKNPHTEVFPFAQTVYWKRKGDYETAAGRDDEPTRATIGPRHGQWPQLDFELPRQRYELEKVRQLMQTAYERGRKDNRAELGNFLKDLISV